MTMTTTTPMPTQAATSNNAVLQRLVALRSMDVNALRALWLQLYCSQCPKHLPCKSLILKLTYRIQELAYGLHFGHFEVKGSQWMKAAVKEIRVKCEPKGAYCVAVSVF